MKPEKSEQPIRDKSHSRTETLTDLPVDETRQDEVKGGEELDTKYRLILYKDRNSCKNKPSGREL
jgi:hypothetical protein